MDKLLRSRIFRFLVCFVLVCSLLINWSPLRAEATEIGIGVTGIGVLFWFMLMFGGMVIEPTQDVLNGLDRAGQAYIDDWIEDTAEDVQKATESWKESVMDINEWMAQHPDYKPVYPDPSPQPDPDWGFHWDENGNIVLGSMLGGALARWIADSILADGVEVEDFNAETVFYGSIEAQHFPFYDEKLSSFPFHSVVIANGGTIYYILSDSQLWVSTGGDIFNNSANFEMYFRLSDLSWSTSPIKSSADGDKLSVRFSSIQWSNFDVLMNTDASVYFSASDISTSKINVAPEIYVGDIPSQVKDGTFDPDRMIFPAFDLSRVLSNQESTLQEMRNLYEKIRDNQMSYEDYVQQIKPLPSPDIDNPDPSPSVPGETTPEETKPDEDDDEDKDLDMFTLDLSDYFPFCIPFDLYDFFTCLNADPVAPVIDWQIPLPGGGFYPMQIDLSAYDDVAQLLRRLQLLLFCVGLAFKTRDLIKG